MRLVWISERERTQQDALRLALPQDGLKYSQQGFGQLLLQVVLGVDGNVVLQHVDRILKSGGIWINVRNKTEGTNVSGSRSPHL